MIRFLLCCLLLLSSPSLAREGAVFFESVPDMPLMEGLIELSDQTVRFDKTGGRIVQAAALIDSVTIAQTADYYAHSLPQFGWERLGEHSYIRGSEVLELRFENYADESYLYVLIAPR